MNIIEFGSNAGYKVVEEAWRFSRPNITEVDGESLKSTDLPVAEFARFDLHIESTIIEREIFATMRDHVMWAQTSRVQDVLAFEYDDVFEGIDFFEDTRVKMIEASKHERQDDYRLDLPLLSNTKYSVSVSLRTLVKLMNNFMYIARGCDSPIMNDLLIGSANSILEFIKSKGYTEDNIGKYKTDLILGTRRVCEFGSRVGENLFIGCKLPMHLRSHLVRHRDILFTDNLFDLIVSKDVITSTLRTEVRVEIVGSIDSMHKISSKRSCWIAQYNIWSPLLNKIADLIPEEVALPCADGVCPFSEDAMARYEGKDPNPPCPVHCSINDLKTVAEQRVKMYDMVTADNRPSFWATEIDGL